MSAAGPPQGTRPLNAAPVNLQGNAVMKPVWIVDDDRSIRWVLEKALERDDIPYESFVSAQEVLRGKRCPHTRREQ